MLLDERAKTGHQGGRTADLVYKEALMLDKESHQGVAIARELVQRSRLDG